MNWVDEAYKHLGVAEIPGVNHHPLILKMWKAIKRGGIQTDEVPWCAAFVGFCLENVGIVSSRYESAHSYLKWGQGLDFAAVGAIAVFDGGPSRPGLGHVGFVMGRDANGRLMVLGGNQGNKVSVAPFDLTRVLSYRWPIGFQVPVIRPLPEFKTDQASSTGEA